MGTQGWWGPRFIKQFEFNFKRIVLGQISHSELKLYCEKNDIDIPSDVLKDHLKRWDIAWISDTQFIVTSNYQIEVSWPIC